MSGIASGIASVGTLYQLNDDGSSFAWAEFRVIRTSSFPCTRESSERNMRRLAQLLPAIVTRWIVVLNGAHVTNIRVRIGINCRSAHVTSWNQIPECG